MLTLDGKPVANFRKSMSLEGEHNEALASDPRLAHAPITQVKERETHVFLGRKQLVQVLLARGVKIPKVCRDPTPEEIEAGAPADGKIPTDELGCEIYLDGKPFERTIEIVFPNPAD